MLVDSVKKFNAAVCDLNSSDKPVVCDTETTGLNYYKGNRVCGVAVKTLGSTSKYYMPVRHGEGYNLPLARIQQLCKTVLRKDRVQIGFNYAFDIHMLLREEGYQFPDRIEDSQLSAHLLNENDQMKMEALAEKYVDPGAGAAEDALLDMLQEKFGGARKSAKGNLWRLPASEVAGYACQDIVTTEDLFDLHQAPLRTWALYDIYREVCEYAKLICKIEETGLLLDRGLIDQYMAESDENTTKCRAEAAESAGYEINLNSSKQCQAWLGVPSTAKDILAVLIDRGDTRATTLKDYRAWNRANSNYYRPFLGHCDEDGVLHPSLNPTGTMIRLSCRNPPMQAIPRGSNEYKVKDVFIARPGYHICEADFSQAEVRVMGHYTKDPMLLEIIESGVNMHDKVSEEQSLPRDVAKRLNFSAQYGIGAPTFAKTYGYSLQESRGYLQKYHTMFPGMRRLLNSADAKAQEQGYIRLYTGRVQHFDNKRSPSHKASSRLIQGAVAEMTRIAQQRIDREVPEINQLLQVHDSILMEVPIKGEQDYLREIRRIMCDQPWCSVETRVDIKTGPSWGTAKDIV